MLFGAFIGFIIISVFVFGVDNPNPNWPANWRIKPLIVTPLVAAFGALSFYLADVIGVKREWPKVVLFFISAILFLIALWLGTVLGLNGTMWN
jgi:hypothetical protein